MADYTARGMDVSYAQGKIRWNEVETGFAMLRATVGLPAAGASGVDAFWQANVAGAQAAGIPWGAYHYALGSTPERMEAEARHFLKTVGKRKPTYPLALDFEEPSIVGGVSLLGSTYPGLPLATQIELIETFLTAVENAGFYAALYMPAEAMQRLYHYAPKKIRRWDCWVANVDTDRPAYTGPYGMWQYSWQGSIPGVDGPVDLDQAYKDYPAIIRGAGLNNWPEMQEETPETGEPPQDDPENENSGGTSGGDQEENSGGTSGGDQEENSGGTSGGNQEENPGDGSGEKPAEEPERTWLGRLLHKFLAWLAALWNKRKSK